MARPKIDGARTGARDAERGVERHRDGQPEGLAEDLRVLRFGVAGEVGDVERERRPVADHAGERRQKKCHEAARGVELRGCVQDGAEASGAVVP